MKRRLFSLALLLCGALVLAPAADAARVPAGDASPAPNCHDMARQWFGAILLEAEESGSPAAAASAWFAQREADYRGSGAALLPESAPLLDAETAEEPDSLEIAAGTEAEQARSARLEAIREMQERLEITVTDADVTAQTDRTRTQTNPDGTVTLYVYEWTFLDYDDLTDGPGGTDVAGFGVWHKLTVEPVGDGWRIVRDEYDEEDFLGVSSVTEETRNSPEASFLLADHSDGAAEAEDGGTETGGMEEGGEEAFLLDASPFYPGYSPDAAAAYADRYAMSYNPAWPNYNSVGGDCANFTSQCIYAGGMPMEKGSSGWYHKLYSVSVNSDRSSSWTFARELYNWMGANRGVVLTAADDTVIKGSPVFYVNKGKTAVGHAAICVGQNSAGRPIIDGHSNDAYHAPWNYAKSAPAVYTVQLTGDAGLPLCVAGERYPTGKIALGTGYGLRGVIRSSAVITRVSADVLDHHGNPLPDFHYEEDWNDYRYDIRTDGLNDFMVFDQLPLGRYTYVVRAEDAVGASEELIRSGFETAASEITLTGETFPTGVMRKGNSFRLEGIIQSNLPLTRICAYVYNDAGKPVSDRFVYERSWSSSICSIYADGINSAFVFNNLGAGSYVYTVTATDAAGSAKTLIEAPFTVSAFTSPMEAPSMAVSGSTVYFSWQPLAGAESYRAVLCSPDTGEPLYAGEGTAASAVLENVKAGTYDACVIALAGEESRQSPAMSIEVNGSFNVGVQVPIEPSVTVERVSRSPHRITLTTLLTCEETADAYLAAAAYRNSQFLCFSLLQAEAMEEAGQQQVRITLTSPVETPFDDDVSVKLFLLEGGAFIPMSEAASTTI